MNNHFLNSSATKIISTLGYIIGFLLFIFSIVMLFIDFASWFQYTVTGSLGLGIFMISNITIAHHENTELILRIIKRQEELFKESKLLSKNPLDLLSGGLTLGVTPSSKVDNKRAEDIANMIKETMENAINETPKKKTNDLEKLSVKELKKLKDEHIASEDYEKADRVIDEINKRKEKDDEKDESKDDV